MKTTTAAGAGWAEGQEEQEVITELEWRLGEEGKKQKTTFLFFYMQANLGEVFVPDSPLVNNSPTRK